jgi:hypothetical protein
MNESKYQVQTFLALLQSVHALIAEAVLYSEADAAFAVGCERYYPESAIPIEVKDRPDGTKIGDLTFWSI